MARVSEALSVARAQIWDEGPRSAAGEPGGASHPERRPEGEEEDRRAEGDVHPDRHVPPQASSLMPGSA